MKRLIWSALIAGALSTTTVLLASQSAAPQQPPAPSAPQAPGPATAAPPQSAAPASQSSSADPTDHRITVTGCLQESPQTPTGTSGTAEPRPEASNGSRSETKGDTAGAADEPKFVLTKAVASATAATPGTPGQTYRLIANESALKPHVGKKVELTGTLEDAAATTTAGASPKLRVTAGKVLAASCLE
jgi:hypothetical protein